MVYSGAEMLKSTCHTVCRILVGAAWMLAGAACSQEEPGPLSARDAIGFQFSLREVAWHAGAKASCPAAKAEPVSPENLYGLTAGIFACHFSVWSEEDCTPNYIFNLKVADSGSGWEGEETYYWPADGKMRFYAYAPYKAESDESAFAGALQLPDKTAAGTPVLTYTVPERVEDQQDLLTAEALAETGEEDFVCPHQGTVSLKMQHSLTAVEFVYIEGVPGTVASLALEGVFCSGSLRIGASGDRPWTLAEATASFSQTVDVSVTGTGTAAEPERITSPSRTFMMLPQQLPEGAKIHLVFDDGSGPQDHYADLSQAVWPAGSTVTYFVSIAANQLNLTASVSPWDAVTEYIDYKDEVSVADRLRWEEGTYSDRDSASAALVLKSDGTPAVAHFTISTPRGATWYATFETLKGSNGAFKFLDSKGEKQATASGAVGSAATLRIVADREDVQAAQTALLRITVRRPDGTTLIVKELVEDGKEYTLIQNPNV